MHKSDGGPVSAGPPDLLYVIGPGTSGHEELRHSLRSVAKNLRHGKVWIVGSIPDWVRNTVNVPLAPLSEKFPNIRQSYEAALDHSFLSEQFLLMNDDMFAVRSVPNEVPAWHLGPASKHLEFLASIGKDNDWVWSIRDTIEVLGDRDLYECHIPLLFSKERLRGVLSAFPKDRLFNAGAAYTTARAGAEGVLGPCVKVTSGSLEKKLGTPFLSSVDWSFAKGEVGQYVRSLFPEKCRYEA